jgi:chromosome segregation ATPase
MVIDNLRKQLDEYKTRATASSYESLTNKISDLESQLAEKNKLIEDMKASSNVGGGSSSADINDLRTKMIVLQSKIRAGETKIQELTTTNEELEAKCKRNETKAGDSEQAEILKRQLKQEMETTENLRNQINQIQSGASSQSQQEIQDLRRQLSTAQMQAGQGGSAASSAEINRLRQEISARDQKIAELEKGGGSATATGPMGNVRLQREVNALKAQIDMLKRNEADMRSKYESAMRKSEQKEEEW